MSTQIKYLWSQTENINEKVDPMYSKGSSSAVETGEQACIEWRGCLSPAPGDCAM